jgi:hypothetical protein
MMHSATYGIFSRPAQLKEAPATAIGTGMNKPNPDNLRTRQISNTVTLGICDVCNAQYRCYLPKPDQARWELKAWFDGHICSTQRKKIAIDHPDIAISKSNHEFRTYTERTV